MKSMKHAAFLAGVVAAAVLLGGCGKQEQASPTTGQEPKPSGSALSDAQKAVGDAAAQAKEAAQKAAGDAAAAAQAKAQSIIDQAKGLVSQSKYQDALNLLQQNLGALKLTPEQQKLVESLKEQIQKALAASAVKDATKAVGDLKNPLGK
jgi:hypothetical protein